KHRDWMPEVSHTFSSKCQHDTLSAEDFSRLETAVTPWLADSCVRDLISSLAESSESARQHTAWRILATAGPTNAEPRCVRALDHSPAGASAGDLPLVLDAAANVSAPEIDYALKRVAEDEQRPLALRLKALRCSLRSGSPLPADCCRLVLGVLQGES